MIDLALIKLRTAAASQVRDLQDNRPMRPLSYEDALRIVYAEPGVVPGEFATVSPELVRIAAKEIGYQYQQRDTEALIGEVDELRQAIIDLLMSADASWEEKRLGHDWHEACQHARRLIGKE